jgi:hypothetical protein
MLLLMRNRLCGSYWALDRAQAFEVVTELLSDDAFVGAFVSREPQIGAAGTVETAGCLDGLLHPLADLIELGGIVGAAVDTQHERCTAVTERRVPGGDGCGCAAHDRDMDEHARVGSCHCPLVDERDGVVGQLVQVGRLPVAVEVLHQRVEPGLERPVVRNVIAHVEQRLLETPELVDDPLALVLVAGIHGSDDEDVLALHRRREVGCRRKRPVQRSRRHLVTGPECKITPTRHQLGTGRCIVEHHRKRHLGADFMGSEREVHDDAEVPAATSDRPEQIGMLVGAGRHEVT